MAWWYRTGGGVLSSRQNQVKYFGGPKGLSGDDWSGMIQNDQKMIHIDLKGINGQKFKFIGFDQNSFHHVDLKKVIPTQLEWEKSNFIWIIY